MSDRLKAGTGRSRSGTTITLTLATFPPRG